MSAEVLLTLRAGEITWADALSDGRIQASGERADLSPLFLQLSDKK
jgi:hypothetical protein